MSLIEIIRQHRRPETLPFLAEALQHQHETIWKTALDGIVAIGVTDSLQILETEKKRLTAHSSTAQSRSEWIDEAISQIKSALD